MKTYENVKFDVNVRIKLVNVNAPVVATTSWWWHFLRTGDGLKGKKSIPVDFMIYL